MTELSNGFSPAATTRILICPSAGSGTGRSTTAPGSPNASRANAFMDGLLAVVGKWSPSNLTPTAAPGIPRVRAYVEPWHTIGIRHAHAAPKTGSTAQGQRGRPSPRDQPGHASALGSLRPHPMRPGRIEPSPGPHVGGRTPPGRSTHRDHGNPTLRPQPDRRRGPRGQGRQRHGAGRDRSRPVSPCRRHHRGRCGGAGAGARRGGGGHDQGPLRDGLERGARRVRRALTLVLAGLLLTACGRSSASTSLREMTKLTVLAAASLTKVFPQIGAEFTKAHPGVTFAFSFGGTDQLAAQIQQGAPADVFAGASTKYGDQLASAGDIRPYDIFCTNQLVLITPASNPAGITSLQDLATRKIKLVIGSETVTVGSYTDRRGVV